MTPSEIAKNTLFNKEGWYSTGSGYYDADKGITNLFELP
jgi:hypothetical protein